MDNKEKISRLDVVEFDIAFVNGSLRAGEVSKI